MAWVEPRTNWTAADGVRDTDLNRIEGNILELYKTESVKADATLYVDVSGNDTTGTGTGAAPFRTINKALASIPNNQKGHLVRISIGTGTYSEDVVISGRTGLLELITTTPVVVSTLKVHASNVSITGNISVSNGVELSNGAVLRTTDRIAVTRGGIEVMYGSTLVCTDTITTNSASVGLRASNGGKAYVAAINGTGNTTGMAAITGGVVCYNTNSLSATTATHTATGGRIYAGAQTSIPNY